MPREHHYDRDKIPKVINGFIDSPVQKLINLQSLESDTTLDKNPTPENLVRQSDAEHLFRFSMCVEIASDTPLLGDGRTDEYRFLVTQESFDIAKEFLNKFNQSVDGQYNSIGDKKCEPENVSEPEEKLFTKIVEAMPGGISSTALMQKLGWKQAFSVK